MTNRIDHTGHPHPATPAGRAMCRRGVDAGRLNLTEAWNDMETYGWVMTDVMIHLMADCVSTLNGIVHGYGSQAELKAIGRLIDMGYVWETEDGDTFCDTAGYEWRRANGVG